MANLIDGLVKGLSGFLPQDDPDVKILNAQAGQKFCGSCGAQA